MAKWSEVSIDFMFELPETDSGNTGLAVVVDKLSKQAHFLPLKPNILAQDFAYVYIQEIYRHHGLPSNIISDRDARFTSKFWSTLLKLLGNNLNISTAFHPETDGQSERAFGVFQEMIRPFVYVLQRDWDTLIAQLEFAYNNTVTILQAKRLFTLHPVNTLRLCMMLFVTDRLCRTPRSIPLPNTLCRKLNVLWTPLERR
jgi:hypothetical protein